MPAIRLDLNVILNMPAGPEMDALVAKEVMEFSVDFELWPSDSGDPRRSWFIISPKNQSSRSKLPGFSTDIEAAWKVAQKMRSRGDALSLQHRNMIDNAPGTAIWTAWFGRANDLAWATTPALAICRAALIAVRTGDKPATRTVNGNFFSIVEHELAKAMGPIASLLVNEKIAEMGESRDRFPESRLDSLVGALGEEISDEAARAQFAGAVSEFVLPKRSNGHASKVVTGNLFSIIEHELAKSMGPIAPTIVNDKITEFRESREAFPEDRVESFVKAVGEEIPDSSDRLSFETAMAEVLLIRKRRS